MDNYTQNFQGDLQTVGIQGVEIFSSGTHNGDHYTDGDLDCMIEAFDKTGFDPTVKAGHAEGQDDEKEARRVFGAPALGYVSKLYRRGGKLLADLKQVPRRFAQLIKSGAYKRVSSEIFWQYRDAAQNKTYPRVLKSVAFLGAEIPALTNLQAVENLYFQDRNGGRLMAYADGNEYRVYELKAQRSDEGMNKSFQRRESQNNEGGNVMNQGSHTINLSGASTVFAEQAKAYAQRNGVDFRTAVYELMGQRVKSYEVGNADAAREQLLGLAKGLNARGMQPQEAIEKACDGNPQLVRQAVDGWLNENSGGDPARLRELLAANPDLNVARVQGHISAVALRKLFPDW